MLLGPGVTNDGNFGLVSYRGISGLYNNNTVDGADNNQAFFSEARGRTRTSYSISQAAIKEFQVGVSNFSAEFGRAAGGTVNAVTKSGTNAFSGEGFYFLRDDKFTAKDPFFPAGVDRPNERRQQFGVSVGGPIRDEQGVLFRQLRRAAPRLSVFRPSSTVDVHQRRVHGTGMRLDPRVLQRAERVQSSRKATTTSCSARSTTPRATSTRSPRSTTCTGGIHRTACRRSRSFPSSPSANGKDIVKTDFALFTVNSVLSNRWLNEARVQIGRDFEAQEPNTPAGPGTTVTGGIDIGIPNFLPRPKYPDERRYQFIDNVTLVRGRAQRARRASTSITSRKI